MARLSNPFIQVIDANGDIVVGAKMHFFETGTSTKKAIYSDSSFTTAIANPIETNSKGQFPDVYLDGVYRVALYNDKGVLLGDADPVGEVSQGQFDVWSSDSTYNIPDIVMGSDNNFYRSIVDANQGNDPISSPTQWEQLLLLNEGAQTVLGDKTLSGTINFTGVFQLAGVAVTSTAAELNILDGVTATTAELNVLDGVTSTTAELNILDGVTSTTAELNILDGVTSTAAELNILDGVTSTTAELNILDGVTSTAAEINKLDGVTATTAEINHLTGSTTGTAITTGDNPWLASNLAAGTRGALVKRTAVQSITTGAVNVVNFDAESYDTDSIHDTVTNNDRLVVPTGITKIRLFANVKYAINSTGIRGLYVYKNGVPSFDGSSLVFRNSVVTFGTQIPMATTVLSVSGGDYFHLGAWQNSGGNLDIDATTWFAMELIQ